MLLFRKSDDFFGLRSEKVWWYPKKTLTLWAECAKLTIVNLKAYNNNSTIGLIYDYGFSHNNDFSRIK